MRRPSCAWAMRRPAFGLGRGSRLGGPSSSCRRPRLHHPRPRPAPRRDDDDQVSCSSSWGLAGSVRRRLRQQGRRQRTSAGPTMSRHGLRPGRWYPLGRGIAAMRRKGGKSCLPRSRLPVEAPAFPPRGPGAMRLVVQVHAGGGRHELRPRRVAAPRRHRRCSLPAAMRVLRLLALAAAVAARIGFAALAAVLRHAAAEPASGRRRAACRESPGDCGLQAARVARPGRRNPCGRCLPSARSHRHLGPSGRVEMQSACCTRPASRLISTPKAAANSRFGHRRPHADHAGVGGGRGFGRGGRGGPSALLGQPAGRLKRRCWRQRFGADASRPAGGGGARLPRAGPCAALSITGMRSRPAFGAACAGWCGWLARPSPARGRCRIRHSDARLAPWVVRNRRRPLRRRELSSPRWCPPWRFRPSRRCHYASHCATNAGQWPRSGRLGRVAVLATRFAGPPCRHRRTPRGAATCGAMDRRREIARSWQTCRAAAVAVAGCPSLARRLRGRQPGGPSAARSRPRRNQLGSPAGDGEAAGGADCARWSWWPQKRVVAAARGGSRRAREALRRRARRCSRCAPELLDLGDAARSTSLSTGRRAGLLLRHLQSALELALGLRRPRAAGVRMACVSRVTKPWCCQVQQRQPSAGLR